MQLGICLAIWESIVWVSTNVEEFCMIWNKKIIEKGTHFWQKLHSYLEQYRTP